MAPVGVLGLCTQDGHGDLAAARPAACTGVPAVASTLSVDPMEQVAAERGGTPGFDLRAEGRCAARCESADSTPHPP